MALPLETEIAPAPEAAVDAREGARLLGISIAAFWRGAADGRIPEPFYPAARSARWWPSELRAAVALTRMKPAAAKAERKRSRDARRTAETEQTPGIEAGAATGPRRRRAPEAEAEAKP